MSIDQNIIQRFVYLEREMEKMKDDIKMLMDEYDNKEDYSMDWSTDINNIKSDIDDINNKISDIDFDSMDIGDLKAEISDLHKRIDYLESKVEIPS